MPRITIEPEKIQKLRALSLTYRDKRFALFVHLLIDTGARKSELIERSWDDFDMTKRQIELETSKTGKPRILHFTEATAALIPSFCPGTAQGSSGLPRPSVPSVPKDYRASWRVLVGPGRVPRRPPARTSGTTGRASCWWRV